MTAGRDNIVKVFNFDNKDNPIVVIEIRGETLIDVCWLPQNPNMILVGTAEGNVYLYDLGDSVDKPRETIAVQKNPLDRLTSICISPSQNAIVALSKKSGLWVFTLSSAVFDDRFVLDKVYTG